MAEKQHRNSKIIEVKRAMSFLQQQNAGDKEVMDYFNMAYKAIGAYYKEFGSVVATGLSRKEEFDLMPELIGGIDPKDSHLFRGAVQKFFTNLNVKIPAEGIKLEIGLQESNTEAPDSVKNAPIKIRDYIVYRWLLEHPQMAANKDEADKYQHKQFYIEDMVAINNAKTKLRTAEDTAQEAYLDIKKDARRVEMVLTLLGIDTRTMNDQQILLQAKQAVTVDTDQSDDGNLSRLQRFVDIHKDKDLLLKYDILEMIRYGILERVKSKILDKTTNDEIGNNLREAVVYFQDKGNSKIVNMYYAKLEELATSRRIKHKSPWLGDGIKSMVDGEGETPKAPVGQPPIITE